MSLTICITGTGTGVGKTLLTALLTIHLRNRGIEALAVKPYCSGSLDDAKLLSLANEGTLSLKEISPVYCRAPLAPLATLDPEEANDLYLGVLEYLNSLRTSCELLLVEGVGGAAVPLTRTKTIGDLMVGIGDKRICVGTNRLGILNKVMLTESYFSHLRGGDSRIVLMEPEIDDPSCASNVTTLQQVLGCSDLVTLPHLGAEVSNLRALKTHEKKLRKTLVQIIK